MPRATCPPQAHAQLPHVLGAPVRPPTISSGKYFQH